MTRWFRLFTTLRNKTRGHGATKPADCAEAARHMHRSIHAICLNFHLFERQWVYLYRNLILHMFGPSSTANVNLNMRRGLRNFIRNVSDRIDKGESFAAYEPILDMVCRAYNPGWLQLAEWRIERGSDSDLNLAILNVRAFLQGDQNGPGSVDAWRLLANVYYMQEQCIG